MSSTSTCRECGKSIPTDSPGGFCAKCLLGLGFEVSAESKIQGSPGTAPSTDVLKQSPAGIESVWPTEGPTRISATNVPPIEKSGDRVGRYRLLQEIGQGGCGVVYMAEQEEPVRRRVALKVIKLGMDTKQVVARFEAERQALALMDHPNIAKVLDAGATDAGRPYFVMELVRGIRITDYCDQNNLPTSERLKLFIQVCQAIQHAHQKGIIHRDIKPSNILVTLHDGVPVPKVIDFGIAKATQGRLTDQTLFTAFEQFIGTPAYMSPEQVEMSGLDIDTRSDIYSLGVLLYELLVGTTPFEAAELLAVGIDQMRRVIREKDPVRPSTRLSTMQEGELTTTARHRQTDAPRLIHLVRGDLDWIVMKCLEKDRTRRYETANGLARDIERHLGNEPVIARPPSSAYRFQKFVRRNKVIVTAATLITMVLILGVLASAWQAVRATREAVRATKAEHEQVRLTRQAQAQERAARLRAYASEVSVALQSWEEGNPSRARALLERQRPKPGEEDLRGFEWRYLYGLFRPHEVTTLRLQGEEVWASAWAPDGKTIAMGNLGGRLELWDWQAARKLESLTGAGIVYGLAFSPDGSKLAYPIRIEGPTNRLRGVALWDLRAKRVTDRFTTTVPPPPAEGYPFPTFSHNGQFLAYVISHGYWKERGNILICDLTGQGRSFELTNFTAAPNIPDFSKDDHFLATPHQDGSVIVWDLKNRKILERLVGHTSIAFCARFSPDGSKLATAGIDCTVRLWNLRGDSRDYFTLGMHNNTVFALSFSSDGKWLVSASLDHTAKVWNVSERKEAEILRGHDQRVYSASFSPDDRFIMTGCEEGTVKIWPAPEPSSVWREGPNLIENLSSVDEFSADNRWLIAEQDNQTRVLDIPSRETNVLDVVRCRISPDAKTAFGLNTNGQLTIWNLSSHVPELTMTISNRCSFRLDVDLALTADGRTLAGVQTNGDVSIWSLAGNVPQQVFVLTNVASFNSVDFAPDAHVLAVQSGDDTIAVWNWSERRQLARLHEGIPPKQIQSYKFSPNGRTFLTTYKDGSARFWETAKWTPQEPLAADAHKRSLIFAFSADGNWLALGRDTDTKVKLWDMSGHTVEYLPSGSGPVHCLAFAPEGLTLAVGTRDGWVNLWHLPSRHEIFPLKAHRSIVHHAVFSPDGRILATAGADGKLRLWVAPTLAEADANPSERR